MQGLVQSLLGLAIGAGGLYIIAVAGTALFQREAMGMGDVKLMGAIGAFLGPAAPLFSLMLGSIIGSAVGLALMALGRARRDTAIPFGPYLAAGAAVYVLWGSALIRAYLELTLPGGATSRMTSVPSGKGSVVASIAPPAETSRSSPENCSGFWPMR